MNSQFFRQYIDLLNEQQAPTRQETERRAKDLAAKMGVAAPNLIDFEAEGGVPVRINGDRVPPNLYTADEKKLIAAARTLSGGAAAAPPQRDGAASSSSVRTGQNPNIDDETRDRARRATGATTPSSSAPTSTTIQSDDEGYHLITTPDGKTVVAGPDDGKPTNKPGSQSQGAAAQSAATGDKPKPGSKVGYANPGTRAYQHWLNSKGVKVAIDGVYGPETQGAGAKLPKQFQPGGDPKMSYNDNKKASDEYMDMLSVGTAYNVIPAPGKPYVWLNSPIYLERMKKYGYDPKTGDPVGGRGGQAGSPGDSTLTPEQKTKLVSSLGSIEAVLAKYKIKTNESVDTLDALVLENINKFTPAEQMQIWAALSEIRDISGDAAYAQMQKDMDARAERERIRSAYRGSQDAAQRYNRSGSDFVANRPQQQSRLGKFLGKLGGASGIGKRIAARAGASALAGPAAAVVGVGAAGWTAWEVGKALWDTFTKTELADLEPQDQEIIKSNLQTILQFQKNPEMMQGLDPELKIRVERVMKGLDKLAVKAGSEEPAGQAASPAAGSQVDQKTADRVRDASGPVSSSSQTSGIRIANEPVIPGQPLSNTQMRVMKMAMDMGNSYPPEVMAQYNKQNTVPTAKTDAPSEQPQSSQELDKIKKNAGISQSATQGPFSIKGLKFGMTIDEVVSITKAQVNDFDAYNKANMDRIKNRDFMKPGAGIGPMPHEFTKTATTWDNALNGFSIGGWTGWRAEAANNRLVAIKTTPRSEQIDKLLDAFTANYGKPKMREMKTRTKAGVELSDYQASWTLPDAVITMFRHIDRDNGYASITSKSYADEESAKYKAQDEKAKKDFE